MELKLVRSAPAAIETGAMILLEWEGSKRPELEKPLAYLYESGEITGKPLELTLLHNFDGYKARRLMIAGAGKREKFDAAALRRVAGAAVRFLQSKGVDSAAFVLEKGCGSVEISAIAEGALEGAWEPDRLKTDKKDKTKPIDSVAILVENGDASLDEALAHGRTIGQAANLARDIAVLPP